MQDARAQVLDLIQSGFPLVADPYGEIARQLGLARDEVLQAVAELRANGSIRRLGASFSSKKLGYASTLCALAVPGNAAEVDRVAAIVNAYPNVTHNYLRENRFNLWFTIIARGADETAAILTEIQAKTGCAEALNLPATRLYKIRVDFSDMKRHGHGGGTAAPEAPAAGEATGQGGGESSTTFAAGRAGGPIGQLATSASPATMGEAGKVAQTASANAEPAGKPCPFDAGDPFDVELVRWAQEDIAGAAAGAAAGVAGFFGRAGSSDEAGAAEVADAAGTVGDTAHAGVDPEPFATAAAHIAAALGDSSVDERRVLERLRAWKADGTIRRFGALVAHRKMGYAFNGMTVWDVPVDRSDAVGRAFASCAFVSHCYERPRSAAWPYNLYAMVHAKTREELDARVGELERLSGLKAQVLLSTREYKKSSMRYFT